MPTVESVVDAFRTAWEERDERLRAGLKLVSQATVEPSPTAPDMQSLSAHLEFVDGARFRLRYSFAASATDNECFLAVENDMGLQFGFLDDINAYLLDIDLGKPAKEVITQVLTKAVKMHQRASVHTAERNADVDAPLVGASAAASAPAASTGSTYRNRSEVTFGQSRYTTAALMQQLNILQKQDTLADGFSATPYPDQLYTWDVKLFFDNSTVLGQDLAKLPGVDHLSLEFKFPCTFPDEPPVVRLIAPVISGGHVTRHGAICMELLSAHGWSPVNSIDTVCIQIRALLVAGDARIDFANRRGLGNYSLEGAMRDYNRVFDQHGWNSTAAPRPAARPGAATARAAGVQNGI